VRYLKIEDVEPKNVWSIFRQISNIPRCSGSELKFQNWVQDWSSNNGIFYTKDEIGNILLSKEAAVGYLDNPIIVFQVHQDMICEKIPESIHNFEKDELDLQIQNGYLFAKDTSLGADNGIGIALAMAALIDPETKDYGKLEVLMTVEEETTLRGALNIKKNFFKGKLMINLDSEKAGVIIVQSAGGCSTEYIFRDTIKNNEILAGKHLVVSNLLGGHSGVDIHLPRVNAIKLVSEIITRFMEKTTLRICRFEGGTRENAIPRSASCEFLLKSSDSEKLNQMFSLLREESKLKYGYEDDLVVELKDKALSGSFSETTSNNVIKLINKIPQGVISFSNKIEGLVQTSNNIGVIRTKEGVITVDVSTRSSDKEDMDTFSLKLKNLGEKLKAETHQTSATYGWSTSPDSSFVKFTKEKYRDVLGANPIITGIHGGLECSQFASLNPDSQILSIGATIDNPHTTRERLQMSSVPLLWDLLKTMIKEIKHTGLLNSSEGL
jgi:dipeptidase D